MSKLRTETGWRLCHRSSATTSNTAMATCHVSGVTCHLSSVAWWQVITVTFGGSTDTTVQCPHDQLFKESTIPLLQRLLVMLVAALAPDYHHHSASAGERRGGPRTRPRAAAASGPRQLSLQGRRVTTTLTQPGHGHGHDKRSQRIPHMEPNF